MFNLEQLLNMTDPGAALIAAVTGGTMAPQALANASAPAQPATSGPPTDSSRGTPAPIDVQGALQALQRGFQAFAARHGGAGEPFASPRAVAAQGGGTAMASPGRLVTHAAPTSGSALEQLLGGVASVNQAGPRAGQASQEYDLGGGQFAHVYYDDKGRRKVFKFRR